MAAVMITKELRQHVKDRIGHFRDVEIKDECPDLSRTFTLDASDFRNAVQWGDHVHLLDVIPKDWLQKRTSASVEVTEDEPLENGDVRKWNAQITFDGLTRCYERPHPDRWGAASNTTTKEWVEQHSHLAGAAEALQRLEDTKRANAIRAKYQALANQLLEFLGQCRSLNEAVKLMPNLKHYVGREYLERLDRKAERKTVAQMRAEELLSKIDQDTVAAVAIAAKLQENNGK